MFQALKRLTRRLLKVAGTLLPLLLATPAMAQWGTETTKVDTSRFINGAFNYGLVMPHQEVIVGLLDTTITSAGIGGGNALKVIVGSLLDHEDNCANYNIVNGVASCEGSYEKWRELEKSTSWHQANRGDTTVVFPTNYAVTITTGQDSVVIWDRDTAELWMTFNKATNTYLDAAAITDIAFKDGVLWMGTASTLRVADFLSDRGRAYHTGGVNFFKENIQERNRPTASVTYSTALAILNNNINSVTAVRDPFGLKDALGRPERWWIVSSPSNGGGSLYNPHTNTIVDQASTSGDFNNVSVSDRGQIWMVYNNSGGYDKLSMMCNSGFNCSIFGQAADGWQPYMNYSKESVAGQEKLAWSTGINGTKILASNNRNSIVGENADNAYAWCDEGVYILSPSGGFGVEAKQQVFAKQRWSSTVNAPVGVSDVALTLAFEDNTTDSSPYGNTLTVAAGSPGTVTAVFGKGYSSTHNSRLTITNDSDLTPAALDFAVHFWIKSESATNPVADTNIFRLSDNIGGAGSQNLSLTAKTTGYIRFYMGATSENETTPAVDVWDAEWHHIAWVEDSGILRAYIDGIVVGTVSSTHAIPTSINDFELGSTVAKGSNYIIDDFSYTVDYGIHADVIAKIYAEGRKKLGMPSAVFSVATSHNALLSNNLADIDALDNGIWAAVFSDANTAQIFDGRIPLQEIAVPAGTVKTIALIANPGADSVGVVIGTDENLKFVQPSVNLRAAMAHQYKEQIHVGTPVVVDSAGVGGIFWTGDDVVSAAHNAGRSHIFVMNGTYPGVHMTKNIQRFECASPKTGTAGIGVLFDGGTTNEGIWITSAVEISGCAFYTAPDGAGGGNSAVNIVGGSNINFHNNVIVDADATGISISGSYARITNNSISGADGNCITGGSGTVVNVISNNEIRNCGSNGIQLGSGANSYVVVGNVSDQAIVDDVGTSTVTGNEVY